MTSSGLVRFPFQALLIIMNNIAGGGKAGGLAPGRQKQARYM